MPFDPAPSVKPLTVYQEVADAILRGCALTKPTSDAYKTECDGLIVKACVWGAYHVGLGRRYLSEGGGLPYDPREAYEKWDRTTKAYEAYYNLGIVESYLGGIISREEVAARIAAL